MEAKIEKKVPDTLDERLSVLETFIARRFDELSAEINATSVMIDMNEEALEKRFSEVLKVMDAVSTFQDGGTSSNSGYELDTVVSETEKATNDIMDAADRIDSMLKNEDSWDNKKERDELLEEMRKDIEAIMMSCSFQDLTGQRIHKAVNNIKDAEKRLEQILKDIGIQVSTVENLSDDLRRVATSQDDIDILFSAQREE